MFVSICMEDCSHSHIILSKGDRGLIISHLIMCLCKGGMNLDCRCVCNDIFVWVNMVKLLFMVLHSPHLIIYMTLIQKPNDR